LLGIGGAGRTGQEFNQRKNRKGAFWEDRYHATAVEGDFHLIRCMVYIDLNMVRAGVVVHPSEWLFSGYNDIQIPRKRYSLLDYEILMALLNIRNMEELKKSYRGWVEEELVKEDRERQPRWTESVAVGSDGMYLIEFKSHCLVRPGKMNKDGKENHKFLKIGKIRDKIKLLILLDICDIKLETAPWGFVIFKSHRRGKGYTHEHCSQTT
jgi:hypothetical protein